MKVTFVLLLLFAYLLPASGQQGQRTGPASSSGTNEILIPMMKMLAALVQPNPLLQNRTMEPRPQAVTARVTQAPIEYETGAPERLSQQPLSIFNWFMSPLRLAVIMKKYEFQPMNLPRNDDTFFFDTKRDWGLAFGITCACLAPLMLLFDVWAYYELQPFKLPRHPTDQSTWLSRWLAGERAGPLTC